MSGKDKTAEIHDVLDIRGDVCPYTLVKSRMALEKLQQGQTLEIHIGNSESAANVPRSLDLEGHEVLSVERDSGGGPHWIIKISRGSA